MREVQACFLERCVHRHSSKALPDALEHNNVQIMMCSAGVAQARRHQRAVPALGAASQPRQRRPVQPAAPRGTGSTPAAQVCKHRGHDEEQHIPSRPVPFAKYVPACRKPSHMGACALVRHC